MISPIRICVPNQLQTVTQSTHGEILTDPKHRMFDGADTLRFGSTDEYFKTVEHEPHRILELVGTGISHLSRPDDLSEYESFWPKSDDLSVGRLKCEIYHHFYV